MTQYNKTSLQSFFETGDVPQGTDYSNLIDSCINAVETTAQAIAGPLVPTELITPRVSAAAINATVALSAAALAVNNALTGSTASFSSTVSANAFFAASGIISNAGLRVDGTVSAGSNMIVSGATTMQGDVTVLGGVETNFLTVNNSLNTSTLVVNSTVTAATLHATTNLRGSVAIVSAAGTTQGTAALISTPIVRARGVVDGSTTGFALPANRTGAIQMLYSDAVSANLWPPTGGTINALGANTAFPLAANTLYTIVHIAASAYAVR